MYAISKRHHARRKHLYEMYSKIRLGHDHSQVIPGLPVCSISVADPVHFLYPDPDPDLRIRFSKYVSVSGTRGTPKRPDST